VLLTGHKERAQLLAPLALKTGFELLGRFARERRITADPAAAVAPGEAAQGLAQARHLRGQQGRALLHRLAADLQRVGQRRQAVRRLRLRQPGQQPAGDLPQLRGLARRQQNHFAAAAHLGQRLRWRIFRDDQMAVGAARAKG